MATAATARRHRRQRGGGGGGVSVAAAVAVAAWWRWWQRQLGGSGRTVVEEKTPRGRCPAIRSRRGCGEFPRSSWMTIPPYPRPEDCMCHQCNKFCLQSNKTNTPRTCRVHYGTESAFGKMDTKGLPRMPKSKIITDHKGKSHF